MATAYITKIRRLTRAWCEVEYYRPDGELEWIRYLTPSVAKARQLAENEIERRYPIDYIASVNP